MKIDKILKYHLHIPRRLDWVALAEQYSELATLIGLGILEKYSRAVYHLKGYSIIFRMICNMYDCLAYYHKNEIYKIACNINRRVHHSHQRRVASTEEAWLSVCGSKTGSNIPFGGDYLPLSRHRGPGLARIVN